MITKSKKIKTRFKRLSVILSIRFTPQIYETLQKKAIEQQRPISEIVREAVEKYIQV
ncbi:MAG: hypothetical protein KatS3mg101_1022 [Patescibacteria group bacterium]|nr:MAG: hypothetical protein KatS3mg101_1022 [Patescibacteria group bacterium]